MKKLTGFLFSLFFSFSLVACEDAFENTDSFEASGQDGVDGQDGAQGPQGPEGEPGRDGTDGEDGTDGVDGQDGEDYPNCNLMGNECEPGYDCDSRGRCVAELGVTPDPTCLLSNPNCDFDGDGVNNADDCDPDNRNLAVEVSAWSDEDGDGFGDASEFEQFCALPSGWVQNDDDLCPENPYLTQTVTYYGDNDGDGYGDEDVTTEVCSTDAPTGYADRFGDNCPLTANPTQIDSDTDGIGDACEPPVVTPPARNFTFSCVVPTGLPATTTCEIHVYYGDAIDDLAEFEFSSLRLSEEEICGSSWLVGFEVNVRLSGPGYEDMPWIGGQYARATDPDGRSIALDVKAHPWADPDNYGPVNSRIPYCE